MIVRNIPGASGYTDGLASGDGGSVPNDPAIRELQNLWRALDEIDDGVILLGKDLHIQFMNKVACEFGGVKAPPSGRSFAFEELIRESHYANPISRFRGDLEAFIERRIASVRAGDPTPVELYMANGRTVRSKCVSLPDGGRLLSYTDVTDLLRRNEELETLHASLDQVEYGVVLLDAKLRAQFINRAMRDMLDIPDDMADSRPTIEQLMEHGRAAKSFAVAEEDLDGYIAQRVAMIREGDQRRVELRWSRGRVIRCQTAVLPGGGRMLTYTDITDLARTADQLEKLATTDSLTGIYNRRHFMTLAEREWGRFRRYGRPLSLILFDADFFKSVNDRFGHDTGDRLLAHIARICLECRRTPDFVARVGGEEFAMLLPETGLEGAALVAERLRRTVAEQPMPNFGAGGNVPITISVGVAEAGSIMTGVSDLMKLADQMLYEAKRGGRNRIASSCESGARRAPAGPPLVPALGDPTQ